MAGANLTSLILSTITILNATTKNYNIVNNDNSLPEAFHEAGRGLLLVEEALQTAKTQLDGRDPGDPQSTSSSLDACYTRAKLSESLFKVVSQAETPRFERYKMVVRQEGKGNKVEALVKGMLTNVCDLAKDVAIEAAIKGQLKGLRGAIGKLSTMEPSVPDEGLGHSYTNYGGTQNNNTGSGKQLVDAQFHAPVTFN
ncbi:hypothetical protein HIM_10290 [Hirsutella minnesotensis 3608]|uniref:NACHT-NTPase and P-loop NTPases N-terminal domain-containing protein n=1 Tax=Hirsutella minnesotensis 3608 TaxID=1043627 RepID=A0A0F7ZX93_9HYPO|nr:hypothetical protein HIM_10290 [Hirsutella minnesotensis 3608]